MRGLRPARASARGFMVVRAGRARPLRLRGRVVSVQARDRRRLRHGGVGRSAAAFERQGRHVRRLLCGRDADARGHRPSAAPGRHLPRGDAPATTTRTGPTRAAPSSSGSTSRGPQAWRRTRLNRLIGERHQCAARATRVLPLKQYPRVQHRNSVTGRTELTQRACALLPRLARASAPTTATGNSGRSRRTTQNIQVPGAAPSPRGTTSSRAARCATTWGCRAHAGKRSGAQWPAADGHHRRAFRHGTAQSAKSTLGPMRRSTRTPSSLDWYDYLFLGKQNEFASGKPVKIFVMGKNEWRDEDAWPLQRAKETRYLPRSSAGKAEYCVRRRSLTQRQQPTGSSRLADTFIYDPGNPVPTVGGPLCCDSEPSGAGPRDQNEVEARSDVLVYSTPPLDQDTGSHGSDHARPVREVVGRRYRLHGQAGGRVAQRLRAAISPKEFCARASATPQRENRLRSSLAKSTSTRSICGRRATCF